MKRNGVEYFLISNKWNIIVNCMHSSGFISIIQLRPIQYLVTVHSITNRQGGDFIIVLSGEDLKDRCIFHSSVTVTVPPLQHLINIDSYSTVNVYHIPKPLSLKIKDLES